MAKDPRIMWIKTIERTGVNSDYSNEFITCRAIVGKYENGPKKAYAELKRCHKNNLKKYVERAPAESYVITEKNKRQVMFLDRIVDELNFMLENESKFDCKRMRTLADRAFVLVYGENEKLYKEHAR